MRNDPTFQQIVIFDWDDTLCCSSYLQVCGVGLDDKQPFAESLQQDLKQIDILVEAVLSKTVDRIGQDSVYIVTNAEEKWVELSAKAFLPRTFAYMNSVNLKIISARALFESHYPGRPTEWKLFTFQYLLGVKHQAHSILSFKPKTLDKDLGSQRFGEKAPFEKKNKNIDKPFQKVHIEKNDETERKESQFALIMSSKNSSVQSRAHLQMKNCISACGGGSIDNVDTRKCVCSIGDSQSERMAAQILSQSLTNFFYKTIKFKERPTGEQLKFQLKCLKENLDNILQYDTFLDHMLTFSQQFE